MHRALKFAMPIGACALLTGFAALQTQNGRYAEVPVEVTLENYIPVSADNIGRVSEFFVSRVSRVEKDQALFKFASVKSSTPIVVKAKQAGVFYPVANLGESVDVNQPAGYILPSVSSPTIYFQLADVPDTPPEVGTTVFISDGKQTRQANINTLFSTSKEKPGQKVGVVFDKGILFQLLEPGAKLKMAVST